MFIPFQAQSSFIDRKAEGWHWYEEARKKEVKKEKDPEQTKDPQKEAIEKLNAFKQQLQHRLAVAMMDPTYENLKSYMEIQQQMMKQAGRFSNKWLEVLYTTPALDSTVKHPTSQAARHVYLDLERQTMETSIRSLSQHYGLFFFYSGSCAYCRHFAPIVKSFADKHGWKVMVISLDGSALPEFPDFQIDNGSAQALNVEMVPTLLAVEPKSGQVVPLSYGMTTHDQIENRIRVLLLKERS